MDSGAAAEKKEENLSSLHELAALSDLEKLKIHAGLGAIAAFSNKKNDRGRTPLHVAAIHNKDRSHFEVAELLLKNGADPNVKDGEGETPLCYLVKGNKDAACSLEILKLFLKFGADFTCFNRFGSSLLVSAITNFNNIDVVKFLVQDIGLDVNPPNEINITSLQYAACANRKDSQYKIFEYLLKMGVDPNAGNSDVGLPLFNLVNNGNWRVVELFLKHNADVHAVKDYPHRNNILFEFKHSSSDVQVLDKLINSNFGLDVNYLNKCKETPLHYIIKCNICENKINIEVIKCLLRNGANINVPDIYGATAVISIARRIDEDNKEWFLEKIDFFNFLIDQVDFSVVYKNKQVLKRYTYDDSSDEEAYEEEEKEKEKEKKYTHHPQFIWKWILKHLAKLKLLSIPVHPIILEFIESHKNYGKYFLRCTKELELMKSSKPQNSWINFLNLLVDERRKLKNYVGNADLIQDYKNNDWIKMFPIYGTLLKKNVKKGIKRRKLFDRSSILLSDCLPIFSPDHLIVKDILDCILSKKDLSKFCE